MLYRLYRIGGFFIFLFGVHSSVFGQDSSAVRTLLNQLSSPSMHGRGYVQGGLDSATQFLVSQLNTLGLQPTLQRFEFPVNTFPGKVALSINGTTLEAGKDFLIGPESVSMDGSYNLTQIDSATWISTDRKVIVELKSKLTWSVATRQQNYTRFEVRTDAMPMPVKKMKANVEATFIPSFKANNIIASIPGTRRPDSTIVFTAHYDHLGQMGNAVFAGANDNASGAAMLLALAKQIVANPLEYTVQFIFFAGEEAGLVGSSYYVSNPMYPLNHIRFLLNLDLMGNGEEGIAVVNASLFENEFKLLQEINNKEKYLVAINSRGKAQNSDHYFFTEKGVPSFFWYTLGKRKAYHDVEDIASTVPLNEANDLMKLVLQFSQQVILLPRK